MKNMFHFLPRAVVNYDQTCFEIFWHFVKKLCLDFENKWAQKMTGKFPFLVILVLDFVIVSFLVFYSNKAC